MDNGTKWHKDRVNNIMEQTYSAIAYHKIISLTWRIRKSVFFFLTSQLFLRSPSSQLNSCRLFEIFTHWWPSFMMSVSPIIVTLSSTFYKLILTSSPFACILNSAVLLTSESLQYKSASVMQILPSKKLRVKINKQQIVQKHVSVRKERI